MKLILAISALVGFVAAQDLSSLPACGQTCINNMIAQAPSLGCTTGDTKCYCTNPNFAYGLRDCSLQACGAAVQSQVVSFGQAYCATATGGGTATVTSTTTAGSSSSGASGSATSSVSASASSALNSAKSSASSALSSASSSIQSAASSAASKASSSAASSASSSGFAMKTQAPLAAAGVLGLAALLV